MEQFHDDQHLWLRSRVHGTYLHADDDGEGVSLRRSRRSLNAVWAVHIYHGGDGHYLLLHSAAYGRYLAATTTPAPLGHRAVQRNYDQQGVGAIMWLAVGAVRAGLGNDILLRNVSGGCGRYLRANGRYLIWNNGVSVDQFDNASTMRHWLVEPIPPRLGMPDLPGPVRARLPGDLSVVLLGRAVAAWHLIRFVQANNDGYYTEEGWSTLPFRGRSVYHLRNELASRVGVHIFDLIMCVRAGRYGRLTPLVVDLPRDRYYHTIEIVVIMTASPAAHELQHPDVNAE
ncbi:unnamed protein product [Alopecurus aequalis]